MLSLIVGLIVVGVLLWLVNNYIPMDPKVKGLVNAVVIIALVLWIAYDFVLPLLSGRGPVLGPGVREVR